MQEGEENRLRAEENEKEDRKSIFLKKCGG